MTGADAHAHVIVDDLDDPRLSEGDLHHLSRVLRLPPGAMVTAADGQGRWRACRLGPGPALAIDGDVVADPRPEPGITVAFALVKGDRPDWVVQKLTELGVDRIVPFIAERSVVRWDRAKAAHQAARLARIAREAAMQSRRSWLPEIGLAGSARSASPTGADPPAPAPGVAGGVAGFHDVAALPGAVLADRAGSPPTLEMPTVLVGPEGGWSATERATDLPRVCLGEHVLRAETAAVTAGALLGALRSHLLRG